MLEIRRATERDAGAVWKIFHAVVSTGDTYAFPPDMSREEGLKAWMGPGRYCYVAAMEDEILGTFIIKDNQPGLGRHVANASFMVAPEAQGKAIGRRMGHEALDVAKRLGYSAMQFNLVVSTNIPAIRLWQKLGFGIIATIPKAFDHAQEGRIDAHIMYREL